MQSAMIQVEPLGAAHRDGFRALMEAAGHACFCRFWHFQGTKNDWLMRTVMQPELNEAEAFADPCGDDARGLVALCEGELVGWLKIAPQRALPKLLGQSVYRRLPLAGDAVHSLACFLVHPRARGRGVARALLQQAPAFARQHGARTLEAYPRRADYRLPDEQAMGGPEALLRAHGFVHTHGEAPYPVLRLSL